MLRHPFQSVPSSPLALLYPLPSAGVLTSFVAGIGVALILGLIFPSLRSWYTTNINVMITMLLGGLWHGASWNFMLWGGLNGLGLVV